MAVAAPQGVACQTDPIMTPFPLPPIGRPVKVSETSETGFQTDYRWLETEFPSRHIPVAGEPVVARMVEERTQPITAPIQQAPAPVQQGPAPVQEAPVRSAVTMSGESSVEGETQMPAAAVPSPAKRGRGKKPVVVTEPVVVEAVCAPAVVAEPSPPLPALTPSGRLIAPVFSDSSDDEQFSQSLTVPKPPAAVKKPTPNTLSVATPSRESHSASSSDSGVASGEGSSSSDCDADLPSVASISGKAGAKRKQAESPRMGPVLLVEDVNGESVEDVRQALADMLPESLREGAIKLGILRDDKLMVQLRIQPKIVQYFQEGKVTVKSVQHAMAVLSDKQKRKVASLFANLEVNKKSKQ